MNEVEFLRTLEGMMMDRSHESLGASRFILDKMEEVKSRVHTVSALYTENNGELTMDMHEELIDITIDLRALTRTMIAFNVSKEWVAEDIIEVVRIMIPMFN